MFERLQKLLLNKAIGKPQAKEKVEKKSKRPEEMRTSSGIALDEAVSRLEGSATRMDMRLEEQEALLAQVKAEAAKKLTPERRALLETAQRIRKSQEKIIADLDDETKAKLYLTALRAFQGDK